MSLKPLALSLILAASASPLSAEPIHLSHSFGETVVDPEKVQRIVSVGYHEQDFLYALGLAPVGVHEWFGKKPYATWPWAEAARQAVGAEPEVQNGFEIDVEWVWSLQPDLIVATFAPMDQRTYEALSQIAPVLGRPEGFPDWGAPWEEELRLMARATGREAKAEEIIAGLDARIAKSVADHPEFAGKTATMAYFNEGQIVGYRSTDGANRLLGKLGFATPKAYDEMAGAGGNFTVSTERLDLFDLDAVLWLVEPPSRAVLEALPVWPATRMAREGRAIWADPELVGAMSFQSPLSIGWGLDQLVPALATAVAGKAP
ncbi:ABC transporter substrate-binding protein [Paracoccus aminophilus]|nr:ABC transporter substrate-binding protein [Paracoccus aminophilus]